MAFLLYSRYCLCICIPLGLHKCSQRKEISKLPLTRSIISLLSLNLEMAFHYVFCIMLKTSPWQQELIGILVQSLHAHNHVHHMHITYNYLYERLEEPAQNSTIVEAL